MPQIYQHPVLNDVVVIENRGPVSREKVKYERKKIIHNVTLYICFIRVFVRKSSILSLNLKQSVVEALFS